jgi:hypothetical protein
METELCAAVGKATYQLGLEICTVYGHCTVCSCRYASYQNGLEVCTVYEECTVCSCR